MAANMDWPSGAGMVVINKRGFLKTAASDPARQLNPAVWTSRYGSITFNQYAVDWPWAGLNETGLAGSVQMMRWAVFPQPDQRPSTFVLQWLQYQLDTCGSVREVLDRIPAVRIRPVSRSNGAHFFFCDREGAAAVVDFMNGQARVYHGDGLPIPAMTNDPYAASLVYLNRFQGFGGALPISNSNLSQDRFVRAADGIGSFTAASLPAALDAAFGLLDRLALRSHGPTQTQWQVVFDFSGNHIYYHTRNNPRRRTIDMARFDFSCSDPIRLRDVDSGDLDFVEYTHARQRRRVEAFFRRPPLKSMEFEDRVDRIARYPDSFVCQ
jgi:penicillin V acylase-like amidase (Ntn superfamily)